MLADLRESGCMPASTRVLRADTGTEVTLGELVLSQEQPLVWSLDEHWRFVPRRLQRAFPSGIKPVFRLRLRSGYEVDATANHPFRTVTDWRRLDELQVGDAIAVPRKVPEPVESPTGWDDDELVLLAHLLGDGQMGSSVKYATADLANKEVVEDAARQLFGIEASAELQRNTWQVWLPSPYRLTHGRHHPVRGWLEPLGLWGSRSHNKFVPEDVFRHSNDKIALFLHHLWATDGSITLSRNGRGSVVRVYYASTSRRLADDVRRLLLRLDIRTVVSRARKHGYRDSWHVRVQGKENVERFLQMVGSHGARGEVVADALELLAPIKPNPNVDLVPWAVAERVKEAATRAGVTHRQLAHALGEHYCGSYLLGTQARPRRFSRQRLEILGSAVADAGLVELATSDVYWDEIVEIVPVGEMPTFDATIHDTHNFVANGVIAHNSLEQDADVVMFIYREEVYSGADTPDADKGKAEVIVAKHRNGPTGTVPLTFNADRAEFANMAPEP
jgi:replicative DNA helicase